MDQNPTANRLLAALAPEERERIFPHLQPVNLTQGKVLFAPGDALRYVYFPTGCIVSLVYLLHDGKTAELSVVGNEGMVGISVFMGDTTTRYHAIVRSTGFAYRLTGERLMDEFLGNDSIQKLFMRYAQARITQLAQNVACNRHHSVEQQLCRWLLMSLDRLSSHKLMMTHERIAGMLGVRREGITEAAGTLQKLKAIRYGRGHITVLDRSRLEQLSCECYAVVKKESDRLLQPAPRRTGVGTP